MNTRDRIFDLLDASGMAQQDFAQMIGVSKHIVSKWRTTDLESYKKHIPQIAEVLNTTTEYLLTGNGPKVKTPVAVSEMDTITPEEQRLLMAYRIADARAKEMVRLALEPFGLSESSDAAM